MNPKKGLSAALAIARKKVSFISVPIGVLTIFLSVASLLFFSYPIIPNVHENVGSYARKNFGSFLQSFSTSSGAQMDVKRSNATVPSPPPVEEGSVSEGLSTQNHTKQMEIFVPSSDLSNEAEDSLTSGNPAFSATVWPGALDDSLKNKSGSCDIYHGKWIYDPAGPLYTNNTCPIITPKQNCRGNGRPDKDYENWRWKPDLCDLPRFDARKFLELMRAKTLAFVGDSISRNQMESLICILWQVEVPINQGNRKIHRWYFKSTSTMIVRIWSTWLLHQSTEPMDSIPEDVTKLHLDAPDERILELLPTFDVVILSSGHWFAKKSVYVLDKKVVGSNMWRWDKRRKMQINNVEAFGVSVETILSAITTHPNFTGLMIVRSYSPDHYEGGAWSTGGSCIGKTRPATQFIRNKFTEVMHKQQVMGFERVVKKIKSNGSKLKLMDITDVFGYRHDGHPGPYRILDPYKNAKRGPDGQPPPQDCLHWCLPGPVDTWNEIMMEIIRREFEGA